MIYGHPSFDVFTLSNQPSFLDAIFSEFSEQKLPQPDSSVIKKELEEIKELNDLYQKDEYLQKRYILLDRSLFQHIRNTTFVDDEHITMHYRSLVTSLFNDVMPLVYKLKLKYQRPRPFQLAAIHNVPVYPALSYSAQCPAFPSMHACLGTVLTDVISNNFPQAINLFRDIGNDMQQSRGYMALCLPSDSNAGVMLAEKILANKEFKIKYKL